jgi:hypothetical protein
MEGIDDTDERTRVAGEETPFLADNSSDAFNKTWLVYKWLVRKYVLVYKTWLKGEAETRNAAELPRLLAKRGSKYVRRRGRRQRQSD